MKNTGRMTDSKKCNKSISFALLPGYAVKFGRVTRPTMRYMNAKTPTKKLVFSLFFFINYNSR